MGEKVKNTLPGPALHRLNMLTVTGKGRHCPACAFSPLRALSQQCEHSCPEVPQQVTTGSLFLPLFVTYSPFKKRGWSRGWDTGEEPEP